MRIITRPARSASADDGGGSATTLGSRLPYGTPVTPWALARVDRAERAIRALGFPVLRVRHLGPLGRGELAAADLPRALADPAPVIAAVRDAGYRRAEISQQPFRSGSLNVVVVQTADSPR